MLRPLLVPTLLVCACSLLATGAEPVSLVPTLRSVNLSMSHGPDQDNADLHLELVTSFKDGRLLGWEDARLIEAKAEGGEKLMSQGIPESTPNFSSQGSEDDLSIPLSVQLTGFTRPPIRLATLRIEAVAILAQGGVRELVLPANATGRTFAPQDDKTATVLVTREQNQWKLICSGSLARRLVRVILRKPEGDQVDGYASQRERNANRLVLDVSGGDNTAEARPVLILAERVELRPVRLMGDGLALFNAEADPELLPLGKDHAGDPALVVPGAALP
jgi:hypothetical protein